jgi:adenylosuccinate synthase
MVVTKLDVLDGIESLKLCVAYEIDGRRIDEVPAWMPDNVTPIYEEMPGWDRPTADVRKWDDLPEEARAYVGRLGELAGCTVGMISNGADRKAMIWPPDSSLEPLVP